MLVLGIEVNYSQHLKVLPRVHDAVVRECNRRTMQQHAKEHLPLHFEVGADRRYGYGSRRSSINLAWLYNSNKSAYSRVKRMRSRVGGKLINRGGYQDVKNVLDMKPLVWTGQLKGTVLSPINQKITATSKRSRLILKTPPWATSRIKPRPSKVGAYERDVVKQMQQEALRRSAEIQAITSGELRHLRAGFKVNYLDIMRDPANPRHTFLSGVKGGVLRQRSQRK